MEVAIKFHGRIISVCWNNTEFLFYRVCPEGKASIILGNVFSPFFVNSGIVVKIATSTRDFNYAYLTPYFILLFGASIQASSRGLDWINNSSDVQLRLDQEQEIRRAVRHWNQNRKRVELIGMVLSRIHLF